MATLTVGVGAGFDYSTLASAIAASQNGDVIQVQAGTYTNDFAQITTSITIEGVGGMVNLVATETPLLEKGILIIGSDGSTGPDVTLDNISFSGAAISDLHGGNGAGIRYESGNLTLNNCDFFDNQDGLLADDATTGTITINNSQFNDNGDASGPNAGFTHNLYVNDIEQLTIDNSYFYDPIVGHDIKSRAQNTTIENSRIDDPNGTGSYEIDLPNGGNALIENNVIEKGAGAQNPNFIAFGEEGNLHAGSSLTVAGNTVLNDTDAGATFVWNDTGVTAHITDNTTYGLTTGELVAGPSNVAGNTFAPQSDEPALDTSSPYLPVLPFEFACFAAGTHIRTDRGYVPVETLRPGHKVITVDAGAPLARPVTWVGWRSLDLATLPEPEVACPVRIRRDAFSPGVPRRTVFLSPDHAVLVDNVLIAARMLINGTTIAQDMRPRRLRYYHIELEAHGVILADGLPAESFLDTGNRGLFENAGVPLTLHAAFGGGQTQRVAASCRPFVDDAARLEPIWRRLAARAMSLGYRLPTADATTEDPGLHIVIGADTGGTRRGRVIWPVSAAAGRYRFALPGINGPLRLASRAARPCDKRPWVEDRRRLGVMVSELTLWRGNERALIPLDDPRLSRGWWGLEGDSAASWRWTDGDAVIDASWVGAAVLEVAAAGGLEYPVDHAGEAADWGVATRIRRTAA